MSIFDSNLYENDTYGQGVRKDNLHQNLAPHTIECGDEITRCIEAQIDEIWARYDTRRVGYLTKDDAKLFFIETLLILESFTES